MKRLLIILLTILVSAVSSASEPAPAEIKIGFINWDTMPLGDAFIRCFNTNIDDHYPLPITLVGLSCDYEKTMENINRLKERHAKSILEKSGCSYLLYLKKKRNNNLWFVIWKRNGESNFIPVSGGMNAREELTNMAVNSFLSLLYKMDGNFQNVRLY